MAQRYTYGLLTFPNNIVVSDKLAREISDANLAVVLDYINVSPAEKRCDLWFEDVLSQGDHATLSGVVSTHDGVPYVDFTVLRAESLGQNSTTSETWQDKLSLTTTSGIEPGEYKLTWSFKLWSGAATKTQPELNEAHVCG